MEEKITSASEDLGVEVITGQPCPFCMKKTLTLQESERDIPFFGPVFLFSMDCSECSYHKSDVDLGLEKEDPVKLSFDITCEEDMNVRVIRSSFGNIKIPHLGSIEAGETANGFITNVEGILNRLKHQIENIKETTDDEKEKKTAKNLLKKIMRIKWGQESAKLIIEDPTGSSAIISEKTVKTKLK
ncbi:MAG: ZPR1 zinc finger domain-containing protein [Candidatus Woesearchaeota archaeon]|nr:MAG: ZPR1 zinc finger domain-containing protein [Candidatus Woesearchaeota archaeon]